MIINFQQIPKNQIACRGLIETTIFSKVLIAEWDGKKVAVKEIFNLINAQAEVNIMSQLSHPNIVQFYGVIQNTHSIVMEWMSCGTLYQLIKNKKTATWHLELRFELSKDVVRSVKYLHEKKIVHRDLKSLNVLVDVKGESLIAKISDFGLSQLEQSADKSRVGTDTWRAPEVGKTKYSYSADVFSAAKIIWEIFEERLPENKKGEDLDDSSRIADPLKKLLRECWHPVAGRRPNIKKAFEKLTKIQLHALKTTDCSLPITTTDQAACSKSSSCVFENKFQLVPKSEANSQGKNQHANSVKGIFARRHEKR